MPLVLALDMGTSSTRTALFDIRAKRRMSTTAHTQYSLRVDRSGRAEIAPASFFSAVLTCLDATVAAHTRVRTHASQPIIAVGVSCFWHSLIGCDAHGRPVTDIITWADSRCAEDALTLRQQCDEAQVHARTGCMLRASFWPAKLRWLARTQPDVFRRVRRWMSPAEWLLLQLCGESRVAHGMATATGLYAVDARQWDAQMLKITRVTDTSLHAISDEPMHLLPDYARRFPALRDAHIFPAIGDGAASNLGSGANQPGQAAINVGTSGAVRMMFSDTIRPARKAPPHAPLGLFRYRVDASRFLIGGAISNAGNLRAWCLKELRLSDDALAIERILAKRPTPDHGLSVLPFWNAERAPTWREDMHGAIVGITQATEAIDLLQAITEAAYQRLATIVALIPGSHRNTRFIVGGGIQKSRSSLQRLADIIGYPLIALNEPEASLRGAAVFALEKLGHGDAIPAIGGRIVQPDANRARRYAAERIRMAALEAAVFPISGVGRKPQTPNTRP